MLALGVEPGDRVVIALGTSWEWLDAWFGVHLAGGLPVSIAPPGAMGSPTAQIEKTVRVAERLGARFVVAPETFEKEVEQLWSASARAELPPVLRPERLVATAPAEGRLPSLDARSEDTAFLQLTSGSTGFPRAVEISHGSAVHNPWACAQAIGAPKGDPAWCRTMVSWLPLHHDMGLIGGLLVPLVNGFDLKLLTPRSFLARPHLWLQALASHGPSMAPAPNFGYQLCTERVRPRQLEGLDFGLLGSAMTGSEMVRPETMAAFCELAEPYGFDPRNVMPCYGMAEATLAVTFDQRGEGVRTRPLPAEADPGLGLREVVSNGTPIVDTEVRIAGPDDASLPAGRIGEVQIRGPGILKGYFRDPEATAETLRDGWLCTGDLGFLDDEGELFLTGRLKEILILHGQNLMPHELEWIAEEVVGGGSQRAAAFAVTVAQREAQGEQAVLVVESAAADDDRLEAIRHEIASQIGRQLSLPLADLLLVRRGTIPRTSSGKVQRRQLRESYLRGELERLEPES
jgi:fatty-acyl-CoA synthase